MSSLSACSTSLARTSRLRAPSLLSGNRMATQPAIQQTLVVDAASRANHDKDEKANEGRRRETIFGPDVGDDDEPGWTEADAGNAVPVETVKTWVERAKSEEGLHATTTLQALVNLKRPTLLLQQLETEPARDIAPATDALSPEVASSPPLHILKFSYDAITPQVRVTLSIHAPPVPSATPMSLAPMPTVPEPFIVYSGIHEGGFNRLFTLPAESALDLTPAIAPMPAANGEEVEEGGKNESAAARETRSEDTTRSSFGPGATMPDLAAVPELPVLPETTGPVGESESHSPRRFGIFRRRRQPDVEAQIEMSPQPTASSEKKEEEKAKEPEFGMRLLIRIEAIGTDGQMLRRRNAQQTHILINGTWVPDAGSTGQSGAGKRVWIVKVVRREAVIGAHTFLLKEIYGLSANASQPDPPPTTYPPPTSGAEPVDPYASTPNECIVCLVSPRDVVLLPCRHLVACRDCAVGMIEFGAGNKVVRREDATEGDAAGPTTEGSGDAANAAAAAAPAATTTTAAATTRRKKKAKGWYCPICRQPTKVAGTSAIEPSRAPSLRSVRSAHSLRSVRTARTSRNVGPSLPQGAEEMLESLRPPLQPGEDVEEDEEAEIEERSQPQFVLADEIDDDAVQDHENAHKSTETAVEEGTKTSASETKQSQV